MGKEKWRENEGKGRKRREIPRVPFVSYNLKHSSLQLPRITFKKCLADSIIQSLNTNNNTTSL